MGRDATISIIHKDVLDEINEIKESPSKFLTVEEFIDCIIENNSEELIFLGSLSKGEDDWYKYIRDKLVTIAKDSGGAFFHYTITEEALKLLKEYFSLESTKTYNAYIDNRLKVLDKLEENIRAIITVV